MQAIRMLVDAEGSPNGHTVHTYTAGEVYSPESTPRASHALMTAFVASKRAVECDAHGNPVGTPAEKRATKETPAKSAKTDEVKADPKA